MTCPTSGSLKIVEHKQIMKDRDDRIPWTQPGWRAEVIAWIHEALGRRRIRVTGPIEQPHVRPWSTVLRAPTSEGTVFFKASAPGACQESEAVLAALAA